MRVLIVDDSPNIRALVRAGLECAGHQVEAEAATGREAIALTAAVEPAAIVLDVMMPEMTGLEALPTLRELVPTAAIVMFSSIARVDEIAVAAGASAVVDKGAHIGRLVASLESHQA